jgi:hypothetical protein
MDIKELTNYVKQNTALRDEIDGLTKRQTEIKKRVIDGIKELGYEDGNGHIVVDINDSATGIARAVHQRRVSKSLDTDVAETLLDSKGLTERCSRKIFVLNEEEIMAAYYEGLLTEEDIDAMFPSKVTWALVMSKG